MSVGAKNSQCVLSAHLVLDIFYENPASPLYMHIFILFSLILVALIWRKNVLNRPLLLQGFEPRSPAQQFTVLSTNPVIKTFKDIYNLVS